MRRSYHKKKSYQIRDRIFFRHATRFFYIFSLKTSLVACTREYNTQKNTNMSPRMKLDRLMRSPKSIYVR